jgi:cell division GTPase FtsZ
MGKRRVEARQSVPTSIYLCSSNAKFSSSPLFFFSLSRISFVGTASGMRLALLAVGGGGGNNIKDMASSGQRSICQ